MVKEIKTIFEIKDQFDGFIIDQWGVMHNGIDPYPHAIKALKSLQGKKVIILTNSSRRALVNTQRLLDLGFDRSDFLVLLSSGEIFAQDFQKLAENYYSQLCYYISSIPDDKNWEEIGVKITNDYKKCSWILLSSLGDVSTIKNFDYLYELAKNKIPLVCLNPDLMVVAGNKNFLAPGTLATEYHKAGGLVKYFGKPYPSAYSLPLQLLKSKNVLCVGDSLIHDIYGANKMGLKSLFIGYGVHRDKIDKLGNEVLNALFKEFNAYPDYYCCEFN